MATWVRALADVCGSDRSASLARRGNSPASASCAGDVRLVMEDYQGSGMTGRVEVSLKEFVDRMLPEVRLFDRLLQELVSEARAVSGSAAVAAHV